MELILITDEVFRKDEAKLIDQLFEDGLALLHLRKPKAQLSEMRSLLNEISSEWHSRIVVHRLDELVKEFDLSHAHGQNVSRSCHSFEEVNQAESQGDKYAFLSPIFDSISKRGYKAAFDSNQLKSFLDHQISLKVFALGGVSLDKLEQCKDLGFGGVAVLGAVWKSNDPLKAFSEIKNRCQQIG